MENDPNEYTGPSARNPFQHPYAKNIGSSPKIRHGEILAEATGLTQKEIWGGLMDFILFGRPSTYGTPIYELYFCWQAILELQNRERDIGVFEDPEFVVGKILGWSTVHVTQALFSDSHLVEPDTDAKLARTIHHTIVLFIEESIRIANLIDRKKPEPKIEEPQSRIKVGSWCWHNESKQPAWVVGIGYMRGEREGTADIIVKADGAAWRRLENAEVFSLEPENSYTSNFVRVSEKLENLSRIRLDPDELEY